jgi:hypothetical protein
MRLPLKHVSPSQKTGTFVSGRLDSIDSVLRSSATGFIKYNGIAPLLDQFVGTVNLGGPMLLSTTIGNKTACRIQPFAGEIYSTYQATTPDLLGNTWSLPIEPLVPADMYMHPLLQRSMFLPYSSQALFAVTASLPLYNSSVDGLPVTNNAIYMIDRKFAPPARGWIKVFQAEASFVHVQSCMTMYDLAVLGDEFSQVILCAATNTSGFLSLFQVDLVYGRYSAKPYWNAGWNVTLPNARYTTELVAVPRIDAWDGFPDVVVGAPIGDDEPYATILLIPASGAKQMSTLPGARGVGSFKSMAFTADGSDLFAVDEQPAIFR